MVRQKPVDLLMHERGQLGGVIVEIARIEGEHRMAVREHAGLDQDVARKEPLPQVMRVQQAAQLVSPALLKRGSTMQPNLEGLGMSRLPCGGQGQHNDAKEHLQTLHHYSLRGTNCSRTWYSTTRSHQAPVNSQPFWYQVA